MKATRVTVPPRLQAMASLTQPSCKHFFRCLDTDAVMRDNIGGVVIDYNSVSGGAVNATYNPTLKSIGSNLSTADEQLTWNGLGGVTGQIISITVTNGVAVVTAAVTVRINTPVGEQMTLANCSAYNGTYTITSKTKNTVTFNLGNNYTGSITGSGSAGLTRTRSYYPINNSSGTWTPFTDGDAVLMIAAGRVTHGYDLRFAIGDSNSLVYTSSGQGWGMAPDGFHTALQGTALVKSKLNGGISYNTFTNGGTGYATGELITATAHSGGGTGYRGRLQATNGVITDIYNEVYAQGYTAVGINTVDYSITTSGGASAVIVGNNSGGYHVDPGLDGLDVLLYAYHSLDQAPVFKLINLADGSVIAATDGLAAGASYNYAYLQANPCSRISGMAVYGAALYKFSSGVIPTDVDAGALWCGQQWSRGHRYLYPEWVDKV